MKKFVFIFMMFTAAVCFICAFGCGKKTAGNVLIIGAMPDVDSIPYIIAQNNGYYKAAGLEVKIEHFKSARDRDSALQAGLLDGVITDMLAVIFANEGGVRLITPAKTYGDIRIVASKNSGAAKIQWLKGKSIGLSSNTIMEYSFDTMAQAAGLLPTDVKKIEIPKIPTRLEMLKGGKVDAVILPDPLGVLAAQDGAELSRMESLSADVQIGVIAFTEKSLAEKREQILALFKGYDKAVDYLATAPQGDYIDFIIENQGFPKDVRDIMQLPKYNKAETPSQALFDASLAWLKNKGLVKQNHKYDNIVDANLLR